MKDQWCLIFIICLKTCSSLDYEKCPHDFSQGCPSHKGSAWNCAEDKANCTGDQNIYHCVLNATGQPLKVLHLCAPRIECAEGTIPIHDEIENAISCKPCPDGFYQPLSTWSDKAPVCLKKNKCEGDKIECDIGTGLNNTHDVHCRCDARNNFILTNFEKRGNCVEYKHVTCDPSSCHDGQERLLNYSCAPLCPQDQKRDDNDICIPISLVNQTTSSLNDSVIISGETTPKTTTITTTPTSTSMPTTRDNNNNIPTIIAGVIGVPVLIILGVLFIFFRRWNLCARCMCVLKRGRTRRQAPADEGTELELTSIIHGTDANVAAGNNQEAGTNENTDADVAAEKMSSKGASTNKGKTIVQNFYITANNSRMHFGDKNLNTYNFPDKLQKTSDDCSSTHGSDSSLTDSPHLPYSSQGELSVNSNLSSQRNSSEDIELDTQPKQISNGRDSIEINADMEQTYRKVPLM